MFAQSPEQGFSPEMGASVPIIAQLEHSLTDSHAQMVFLCDSMAEVVEQNLVGRDHANYLLEVASKDRREADKLMERFVRPGGFNGPNYQIGGR